MRVLLLLMVVTLSSCMEDLAEDQLPQEDVPVIGQLNDSIETLSSNQISLAQSFCQALSDKEETFPRTYIGATLSLKVRQRDCSEDKGDLKEAIIKAKLGSDSRSGNLRYFPMDYYLPIMTEVETANQGIFAEYCPDMLLNVQKTNSRELDNGDIQIFRFLRDSDSQVMAQVLTSEDVEGEISRIQEVSVVVNGAQNIPRGLVARKIDLNRCGNLEGNGNASLWSQGL